MTEVRASVTWPKQRICEILRRHSFWQNLPEPQLLQIATTGSLHTAAPGVALWEQAKGRPLDLYIILEGSVEIFEETSGSLSLGFGPGDCFGAGALVSEGASLYSVLAASEVHWLQLTAAAEPRATEVTSSPCAMPTPATPLAALFEANPAFQERLGQVMSFMPNVPMIGGWVGGAGASPLMMIQQREMASHGSDWGSMLDAGTGNSSLQWMFQLPLSKWAAVTAEAQRAEWLNTLYAEKIRAEDRLIVGDWRDPGLLEGEVFDLVFVDYVIGAIECFAPHFQEPFLHRIRPHVGRRMYLLGADIPHQRGSTEGAKMIYDLQQLRDACLLLSGQRPFREYPLSWVKEALGRAGFRVEGVQEFPLNLGARFVNSLLNDCLRSLPKSQHPEAAHGLADAIQRFRADALQVPDLQWGIPHGCDYLISAVPI